MSVIIIHARGITKGRLDCCWCGAVPTATGSGLKSSPLNAACSDGGEEGGDEGGEERRRGEEGGAEGFRPRIAQPSPQASRGRHVTPFADNLDLGALNRGTAWVNRNGNEVKGNWVRNTQARQEATRKYEPFQD